MRASAALRVLPLVSLALLTLPATAATTPSGTAVAVIQATNVTGTGGARVLQVEAPVFTGDRVNTSALGEAQLKFRDDTRLVVGPSSSLLIDKFVFSNENTARSVTINAVRGSFRFITGSSPKNAYVIRTPTATIGLRGTRFDFSVGTHGETRLALYEGGLRFCDRKGNCVELTGRCDVVAAAPNRPIEQFDGFQKDAVLKADFPYFNKQDGLRGDFRINKGSCNAVPAPPSIGTVAPPPPPVEEPDCDYGHKGKHHQHHSFDRNGRPGHGGKNFHGDKSFHGDAARIDDRGMRPGRNGPTNAPNGNQSRGEGKGNAPGEGGPNGGAHNNGPAGGSGGNNGAGAPGAGNGNHNGNWSGDGGMGRGGRGFGNRR